MVCSSATQFPENRKPQIKPEIIDALGFEIQMKAVGVIKKKQHASSTPVHEPELLLSRATIASDALRLATISASGGCL